MQKTPGRKTINAWVCERPRRVMIGFHIPDYDQDQAYAAEVKRGRAPAILEDFDPRALARALRKAGVQAFYFYNKCHRGNAYYPSRVAGAHVHSIVARKGDLFGQLCEACREQDIVPLAVYEFSDMRMPYDHPDWCHRRYISAAERERYLHDEQVRDLVDFTDGQQGSRTEGGCLNGPYGEFAIEQARETVRDYPIQGYYVDFLGLFTFGKWVCPYCGPRFREAFGFEFEGIDKLTRRQRVDYIRWHYAETAAYIERLRQAIEAIRPGIVFVHNFHGGYAEPGMQTWGMAHRLTSFTTGDLFTMRAGTLQIDWKLRGYASASRMRPAEALLDSIVAVGRDNFTPKALDSYRAEMWTARAQNVATAASLLPRVDGTCEPAQLALIGKVYAEQAACEPWLQDMRPEYTMGLLRSAQTLELGDKDPLHFPGESQHALEFEGWAQALIQGHFLWDVVHDHLVTEEYLKRFAVVILPNAVCLSRAQCRALGAYVRAGGRLIATGETSLGDEDGERRKDFALASVLGVRLKRARDEALNRLRIEGRALAPREAWVSNGQAYVLGQCGVRAAPGTRALARIYTSLQTRLVNTFVPTPWPGIVQHACGRGRALYFAGHPGLQYRVYGVDTWRRLMTAAAALVQGARAPVSLEGPATVALYAHRQAGQEHLVVNLVHWLSDAGRSAGTLHAQATTDHRSQHLRFGEVAAMPPTGPMVLTIRPPRGRTVRRAWLAPDHKPLRKVHRGREVQVTVPGFNVHAMIVVDYAPA